MTIPKARLLAYQSQNCLCFYCNAPMWEKEPTGFLSKYCLTPKQAKHFQCTAEHLLARCDGGTNARSNIAAACLYCNKTRHYAKKPLDTSAYKAKVTKRIEAGRWFTAVILRSSATQIS